jgi:hypothetical protein
MCGIISKVRNDVIPHITGESNVSLYTRCVSVSVHSPSSSTSSVPSMASPAIHSRAGTSFSRAALSSLPAPATVEGFPLHP